MDDRSLNNFGVDASSLTDTGKSDLTVAAAGKNVWAKVCGIEADKEEQV